MRALVCAALLAAGSAGAQELSEQSVRETAAAARKAARRARVEAAIAAEEARLMARLEEDRCEYARLYAASLEAWRTPPGPRVPEAESVLAEMVEQLRRRAFAWAPVRLRVLDEREANAEIMTVDGCRFLIVRTGLLAKLDNDHQLAAVLAHETAHAELRHNERLSSAAAAGEPELLLLALSRLLEQQADSWAVELLGRAGYDPLALAAVVSNLRSPGAAAGTHPDRSLRVETLALAAKRTPKRESDPVRVLTRLKLIAGLLQPF